MADGRAIPVEHDRLGFITLHAGASAATHIDLRYRGTTEQRVMAACSAAAWIGAAAALFIGRRGRTAASSR